MSKFLSISSSSNEYNDEDKSLNPIFIHVSLNVNNWQIFNFRVVAQSRVRELLWLFTNESGGGGRGGGISLMKMVVVVVMVVGEGAGLSFWEVCPLLLKAEFLCTVPEKKTFISARYLSHFFKLFSDLLT